MKEKNISECSTKAKSWLALLILRLAQDSANQAEFSSRFKEIFCDTLQKHDFCAVQTLQLNANPFQIKQRLVRGMRSPRLQRRTLGFLETLKYAQSLQTREGSTKNVTTLGDIVSLWAKVTHQETDYFLKRVLPKVAPLVHSWQQTTNCSGLTDIEVLAHLQSANDFLRGLIVVLINETPESELEHLIHKVLQMVRGTDPHELVASLDTPISHASTMMTAQASNLLKEALGSNPEAKRRILQPVFGALVEGAARNYDWENNYGQALRHLETDLNPELAAKGINADNDTFVSALDELGKRDMLLNLKDALRGGMRKRFVETVMRLCKTVLHQVNSIWEFSNSEMVATTESVRDWLFRRN